MQHLAEYCTSKAEEAGAEDIYLSQDARKGYANRDSEIFIIRHSIRWPRQRSKSRWNPECALATRLKSRFSDSTCLPEASFPDGPVPAAVRRHYRARRMGIDSDGGRRERGAAWDRKRRNRSKVGRRGRIETEGESPRGNKNNRNGSSTGDAKSGARRKEKGTTKGRHPGLAEGD